VDTLNGTFITPAGDTTVTANFGMEYLVTTSVSPLNGGAVTGGGWYPVGWVTTLKATANTGFSFSAFSVGSQTSSSNPLTLTVNGPVTEVANFKALVPSLTAQVIARKDGSATNQRVWTVKVTNTGQGAATGVQITAATIKATTGTASVGVVSTMPVTVGDIAADPPGTATPPSATADITVSFPATPVTLASLTLTLSANGGAYTTTVTLSNQVR